MASEMEAGDPQDLLRRCRGSDEEAWREFFHLFRRVARRVLNGFPNLTPAECEDAEDRALTTLVAEVQRDGLRATSQWELVAFVRTVVTNCARDVWRQRQPTEPLSPAVPDGGPSPERQAAVRRQLDCARATIDTWSPVDRFIFMMKLENVSAAAISADAARLYGLSLTSGAIDVKFSRLRAQLRHRCQ